MKMNWFSPGSKRAAHIATGQAMFAGGSGSKKRQKVPAGDEDEDEEDWEDEEEEEEEEEEENGDESGEEEEEEEEEEENEQEQRKKLISRIRKNVAAEMRKQMVSNGTRKQIRSIVDNALKGLDIRSLKNFNQVQKTVRQLASSFEKLKNQQNATQKRDALRELLESKAEEIEKVLKTRKGSVTIDTRAAVTMTTQNIITGALPDDILESFSIDAFIPKRRPRQFVRDIADVTRVDETTEYKVWYEEGGEEGAIAIIAEGGLKPLVSMNLVRNTHQVRKAAGKVVFTEEVPKFRKQAYSIIRRLFNDKVWRDYNNIVSADLVAAAAPYPGTTLDGQFENPTDFHAIGAVAAAIESLEFIPDVLIINPQDKWRMALSQDSTGAFFLAIPTIQVDGSISMFGFRVIVTNKITPGNFILGESNLYKIEEEGVQVRIGYGLSMNGTTPEFDLDYNRFRIIGEIFFHNYISSMHAGSYIYGNFAAIKTALTATP